MEFKNYKISVTSECLFVRHWYLWNVTIDTCTIWHKQFCGCYYQIADLVLELTNVKCSRKIAGYRNRNHFCAFHIPHFTKALEEKPEFTVYSVLCML